MGPGPGLPPVDLVVLAGGRATRLGGQDKAALVVGGSTLLERVLGADLGGRTVVVGDTPVPADVTRTTEQPPGGGPVAGIGAGLDALAGMPRPGSPARPLGPPAWVAVCAVDQPGAARALGALRETVGSLPEEVEAVCPRVEGRAQWLLAIYRRAALDAARESLPQLHGASVRSLVSGLRWHEVGLDPADLGDVDTWEDVRRWRGGARGNS
ncbi:molybdenum cofactor guanylyltransferase [Serinicoccus kebangsaanensis]|uniref:molybdenum cofactor guanylyltransferase n=1 Tax=Serinicoccus kebangsaanensis TaxID=2602069 RepID=UPI00124DD05B|nr:NTP transferase domain-containing protein [Serinicoccus kebangsaanensis]